MKFVEVKNVKRKHMSSGKMQKFINDFIDSEIALAEVTEYHHKHAASLQSSLTVSAKSLGYNHIVAFIVDNKVYLQNTLIKE